MSANNQGKKKLKPQKLGTLKLNEGEKQAIAELVESEGFKVWAQKVIPNRTLVIAGTALAAMDERGLYHARGMAFENSKQVDILAEIAAEYNRTQLDEDAKD